MTSTLRKSLILAVVVTSCTTERPVPSSPSLQGSNRDRAYLASLLEGAASSHAAGDVKSGTGTLDIDRVRMDRQSGGRSVLRQYVQPGGTYLATPEETVELWVEYSGANNPRLVVDWGAGEPGSPDNTGCGSCLLTHRYSNRGPNRVSVTLDDRVSTTVTRTFVIDTTNSPFYDNGTCVVARPKTVGCSNQACQDKVCYSPTQFFPGGDAYCCGTSTAYPPGTVQQWDTLCVQEALALCK